MKFVALLCLVDIICFIGGCLTAKNKHPLLKEQSPSDTVPANCAFRFDQQDGSKVCNQKEWI